MFGLLIILDFWQTKIWLFVLLKIFEIILSFLNWYKLIYLRLPIESILISNELQLIISKFEISIDINELHPKNIHLISVTWVVLKLDKSKYINELHP